MCLKEVIEQLLYIMIFIIMNLKFKTQQRYHIKSKKNSVEKIQISLIKVYELQLGAFTYYVITFS